jgi:hypothetical protein
MILMRDVFDIQYIMSQPSPSRSEAIKREEKRGCSMRLGLGVTSPLKVLQNALQTSVFLIWRKIYIYK